MGFLLVAIATLKLLTLSQKAEQPYDTLYTTRSRQFAAYTNFCNKDPVQRHVLFKGRSGFGVAGFCGFSKAVWLVILGSGVFKFSFAGLWFSVYWDLEVA